MYLRFWQNVMAATEPGKQCAAQTADVEVQVRLAWLVRFPGLARGEALFEPKGRTLKLPMEIRSRNVDCPPAVEDWIRQELWNLERFYGGILGCHVMVELPHHHRQRGNPYHVRLELTVAGGEIVVKHQPSLHRSSRQAGEAAMSKQVEVQVPHKDLRWAISDAFRVVGRRLQDYVRRRRGQIKTHEPLPTARVSRLFPDEDYGFLDTADGREIYFHRQSVLGGQFDRLKIGAPVAFVEEAGEKGPQASTVRLMQRRRSEKTKKELPVQMQIAGRLAGSHGKQRS